MISSFFCKKFSTVGKHIDLSTLLEARDARARLQQQYLAVSQQSLLSVTLLAVGSVKKSPLLETIFAKCLAELTACFQQLQLTPLTQTIRQLDTGIEAFFVLPIEAITLKKAMIALEDRSPLARLWDLDVFDQHGKLLSRSELGYPPRPCLLCEQNAKICSRERTHKVDEILAEMQQRVLSETVAEMAYQALLEEVYLTPKAGLVDQNNNGSHRDMTVQTFEQSANVIRPYLAKFVRLGMNSVALSPLQFFAQLRPLGKQAEQAMFQATNGVNTHKGAIFAFGLACGAIGRLAVLTDEHFGRETWLKQLGEMVVEMTQGITTELQFPPKNQPLTAGIRLFQQYGLTGARGEAEQGFPLAQQAVEILQKFAECDQQHRLLIAFVYLLANNQDTNLAHRGGLEGLQFVQQQAQQILKTNLTDKTTLIAQLEALDTACIQRHLSAGGSADLLALAWFFILLDSFLFTSTS